MFVGRKRELDTLNQQYKSDSFECSVVYGRRRIGKTALISEFLRDKPAVFFTARETNAAENLELFSECITTYYGNSPGAVYRNFDDAVDAVFRESLGKRFVLVIDEFPYLAGAYGGISSLLQAKIDRRSPDCKLFIILCGSSMSFMEHQVLGYQSPLYGRRTAQYKIEPFDFFEASEFFPDASGLTAASVYAMTGGVPLYLLLFSNRRSLRENVGAAFLSPSGLLFEEPENLLKQELREPANYNAIIREIASGSTRMNEIASKTGIETGAASHILKTLIELGIVERETPVTESSLKRSGRKSIYKLADNLFRFWYYFMPGLIDMVQRGNYLRAWEFINEGFPAYMGKCFEEIVKQYLWRENSGGNLPFFFQRIGRWWGNDPIQRKESEIDILAIREKSHALFCECKWRKEKTGVELLNALIAKSEHFHVKQKFYILFSKSGFTKSCVKAAEERNDVRLVTFDEMVKRFGPSRR